MTQAGQSSSFTRRIARWAVVLTIIGSAASPLAQVRKDLRYGPRGDHHEGLLSDLKSGGALVLVSATAVGAREIPAQWPEQLRLRFFFPKDQPAPSVSVVQLESLTGYYALDRIRSAAWDAGAANEYAWKTDMLQAVYDYQTPEPQRSAAGRGKWLAGLGALVTLGPEGAPTSLQKKAVAPAVIATSTQSADVAAYRFTFRSTLNATVTGRLTSSTGTELLSGLKYAVSSRTPFTVEWRPRAGQAEGWYTLTVEAKTAPGEPHTEVSFFHKRTF